MSDVALSVGDWEQARTAFRTPTGGINIARAALDRVIDAGYGDSTAFEINRKSGSSDSLSYAELAQASAQFASALGALQADRPIRLFTLLGRVPELYVAALGTLRQGGVFTPLFSSFGPEPIKTRMSIGEADVLVTTERLYERKVREWCGTLDSLKRVVLVDGAGADDGLAISYTDFLALGERDVPYAETNSDDLALVHFTSGTTGKPKGVMHVHEAVIAHHVSAGEVFGLGPGDVYWCTADPGWVTGTSYGIIAPLTHGAHVVVDEAEFDPRRWYETIEKKRVEVFYTAPTAVRMLMKAGTELAREHDFSSLRLVASVGEPLNPEAVAWGNEAFGMPIRDSWWQTETGSIVIGNRPADEVRPGSMGRLLSGLEAAVVARDDGDVVSVADGVTGELAIKRPWPSMMRGYLGEMARYERAFAGEWYLTGDLGRRDADGYYWFVSRADDVIQSAGHLISPFEVESCLLAHPDVAEAAVIGLPDEVSGEIVSAYVSLRDGASAGEALVKSLMGHARKRLGPAVAPRTIEVVSDLPRTKSGKILRRLLRAEALGLDVGDTSTLERAEEAD